MIAIYRRHFFRPHLVTPENPYLFGIKEQTAQTGFLVHTRPPSSRVKPASNSNPHLARHFAARNFLQANPGQDEIVRQVLANIKTTTTFLTGDMEVKAGEAFRTGPCCGIVRRCAWSPRKRSRRVPADRRTAAGGPGNHPERTPAIAHRSLAGDGSPSLGSGASRYLASKKPNTIAGGIHRSLRTFVRFLGRVRRARRADRSRRPVMPTWSETTSSAPRRKGLRGRHDRRDRAASGGEGRRVPRRASASFTWFIDELRCAAMAGRRRKSSQHGTGRSSTGGCGPPACRAAT